MSSSLRKLTDIQIEKAKTYREEGLTLKQIGTLFGVHWTTVFLWTTSEEYRNKKLSYKPKDACFKCGASILTHVRCEFCTILLHGDCNCMEIHKYSLLNRY